MSQKRRGEKEFQAAEEERLKQSEEERQRRALALEAQEPAREIREAAQILESAIQNSDRDSLLDWMEQHGWERPMPAFDYHQAIEGIQNLRRAASIGETKAVGYLHRLACEVSDHLAAILASDGTVTGTDCERDAPIDSEAVSTALATLGRADPAVLRATAEGLAREVPSWQFVPLPFGFVEAIRGKRSGVSSPAHKQDDASLSGENASGASGSSPERPDEAPALSQAGGAGTHGAEPVEEFDLLKSKIADRLPAALLDPLIRSLNRGDSGRDQRPSEKASIAKGLPVECETLLERMLERRFLGEAVDAAREVLLQRDRWPQILVRDRIDGTSLWPPHECLEDLGEGLLPDQFEDLWRAKEGSPRRVAAEIARVLNSERERKDWRTPAELLEALERLERWNCSFEARDFGFVESEARVLTETLGTPQDANTLKLRIVESIWKRRARLLPPLEMKHRDDWLAAGRAYLMFAASLRWMENHAPDRLPKSEIVLAEFEAWCGADLRRKLRDGFKLLVERQ
ncbi:hypothetical protein [Haloferula sp. A504]|uniref:hypothetical protein n=1 Tax=Haloferula sp. A504 TaxID=3373601 RepID=UPI0031C75A24|nr:hypothetical protein [Verrucomicrobiaceae bacterium E54]